MGAFSLIVVINLLNRTIMSRRWSPYDMNGGSIVAIAGEDFAVIGSDTRLSTGFSIWTREQRRIHKISDTTVVGQVGFQGDCQFLMKILDTRSKMYQFDHGRQLSCSASASLVSKLLYSRRFFPLYVYNIVIGCEKDATTGKHKGIGMAMIQWGAMIRSLMGLLDRQEHCCSHFWIISWVRR